MTAEPVTIVVPYVSGIAFLAETLASARLLRGGDWQVIVSDNTRDVNERAAAQALVADLGDRRFAFRAFDEHVDICASFNRAMDCATTDLVALLHADDRIGPTYIQVIRSLAEQYPDAAAYYCAARIIDGAGQPTFSFVDYVKRFLIPRSTGPITVLQGAQGVAALARGNFIMGPTVCFRRSRIPSERWPGNLVQAADLDYWTRIMFFGGTIVGSREVAYDYRRHAAQSTAQVNQTLYRFREEALVYDLIAERAAARGWAHASRVARRKLTTRLQLLYEAANDALHLKLRAAADKLAFLPRLR